MKQKLFFGFGLFLLAPLLVFAEDLINIPGGLDWTTSTIRIEFTRPVVGETIINTPAFSCFGAETNPATEFLSTLNFEEGGYSQEINNCFQQAGNYTVTITLKDTAGNSSDPTVYNFQILPSTPDVGQTSFTAENCTSFNGENVKRANNKDECEISLTLKDSFGNPVYQIEEAKLWSEDDEEINNTDANTATSFRNGLKYENIDGNYETIPKEKPLEDSNLTLFARGAKSFDITALAPSIAKYGFLSQLVERVLNFSIEVPEIDEEGNSSENKLTLDLNIPLVFKNLFSVNIDGEILPWERDSGAPVTLEINQQDIYNEIEPSEIILTNRNPEHISYYNPANLENCSLVCPDVLPEGEICISCQPIINNNHTFDDPIPEVTLPVIANPPDWNQEAIIDGNSNLSFTADITYSIGDEIVSYPAGGVSLSAELNDGLDPEAEDVENLIGYGGNELNLQIIGADIEGGIMGDKDDMVIQAVNGEDSTFTVGGISAQDLRENINENATRLIRGNSNTQAEDFDEGVWFEDSNVAIVDGDVNMPEDVTLPAGKNTLIIKNGNLIIENNLVYANPENDSFGVILINDNPTKYPAKGNIFVRPTVTKLVGTYFADGGIMTTNDGEPDARTGNNNQNGNTNQLVLTGTLFTKNTLGGSILKRDGAFHTPWGPTESDSAAEKTTARNYDLHFVRRYPGIEGEGAECSRPVLGGDCDTNTNAFVIRIDRKASELPPPGFESTGSFGR